MKVCKVCQVEKHGLVFKTARDRANSTTSSPDFIRTRVCVHAKTHGCINREGQINTALKYNDLGATVEEWLDTGDDSHPNSRTSIGWASQLILLLHRKHAEL